MIEFLFDWIFCPGPAKPSAGVISKDISKTSLDDKNMVFFPPFVFAAVTNMKNVVARRRLPFSFFPFYMRCHKIVHVSAEKQKPISPGCAKTFASARWTDYWASSALARSLPKTLFTDSGLNGDLDARPTHVAIIMTIFIRAWQLRLITQQQQQQRRRCFRLVRVKTTTYGYSSRKRFSSSSSSFSSASYSSFGLISRVIRQGTRLGWKSVLLT